MQPVSIATRLNFNTCVLINCSFLWLDEEEEVHDYLTGIRYRNETANDSLAYVSMAGGLEFFIDGAGFDE